MYLLCLLTSCSERKKASRLVKQLQRRLEQETDANEAEKLRHDLHIAQVDEAYTLYFPHIETYVGLYSSNAKKAAGEETEAEKIAAAKAALEAERPPMWTVIEKAMAEGLPALEKLRDRRSPDDTGEVDDTQPPIRPRPTAASGTPGSRPSGGASRHSQEQQKRPGKGPDSAAAQSSKESQPELNRRERRRLMREALAATKDEDDENGDGGFFEEL